MRIKNINTGETFVVSKQSAKYFTFEQIKGEVSAIRKVPRNTMELFGDKYELVESLPTSDLAEQVKTYLSAESQTWLKGHLAGEELDISSLLLALDFLSEESRTQKEDTDRQNDDLWLWWDENKPKPDWETDREYIEHLHDLLEEREGQIEDLEGEKFDLEEFRDEWNAMIPEGPEAFAERLRVWDRDVSLGLEGESAEAILRDIQTGPIRPQSYDALLPL